MKTKFLVLVIIAIKCSAGLQAQTVDEILKNHNKAIGGKEKWNTINSATCTGSFILGEDTLRLETTIKHDFGYRQNLQKGNDQGYLIFSSTNGWRYLPFNGESSVAEIDETELKECRELFNIHEGHLTGFTIDGSKITYSGKETINDRPCYKLVTTTRAGGARIIYIDCETNLVTRTVEEKDHKGMALTEERNFSDYRSLPEGVKVPFLVEKVTKVEQGTMRTVFVYDACWLNSTIVQSIFKPGAK